MSELPPGIITARQEQFVRLYVMGLALGEIANILYVTRNTVKAHLVQASRMADLESITDLPLWYLNTRRTWAAASRLSLAAPDLAGDIQYGRVPLNEHSTYRLLNTGADERGRIDAGLTRMHGLLQPEQNVVFGCHIQLLRLSGVITEGGVPPSSYIIQADGLDDAQEKAWAGLTQEARQELSSGLDKMYLALLGAAATDRAVLYPPDEMRS